MSITVIKGPEGVRTIFSAGETITQLRTLQLMSGGAAKVVGEAVSGSRDRGVGVSAEGVVSGELIRAITQGIASGVFCGSGISAGEALQMLATSGVTSGTGHVGPLLSGLGSMFGRALMSGGYGSGIQILVDLG